MLFKLLACNVFMREACHAIARTPHLVDPEFFELGEHARPERLRALLQARLDALDGEGGKPYHAVLLLFGLCGNATAGLRAGGVPLIVPRAHDCATILLGSRSAWQTCFGQNPSLGFSSVGYMERGDYWIREDGDLGHGESYAHYVEQYGEENARYIWETLHAKDALDDRKLFIDLPETSHLGYAERFRQQVEAQGRRYVQVQGDSRLIAGLLGGDWPEAEYLRVPPGGVIRACHDHERILRAEASAGAGSEGVPAADSPEDGIV